MLYISIHLIILSVYLLTRESCAQTYQNMTLGITLTPITANSWLSPSKDFAFGFRPLETNSELFLLAIWFDKIVNKTVIWTANGGNPTDSNSKVELSSNGQLSLKDGTGQEIWNPGVANIAYAAMLDSGNFMLLTKDSSVKWMSFNNPTDTIIPGQILSNGLSLYARILDADYTRGRFEFAMQPDGNLVLYPIAFPTTYRYEPYWSTATDGPGRNLVFNESGIIYVSLPNNSVAFVVASVKIDTNLYYLRATLDSDGIFRQYSLPKNDLNKQWEVTSKTEFDICNSISLEIGSGACGFNSYCIQDIQGNPNCQCPPHYSFINPSRKYEGCKPDFRAQICEPGDEESFDFVEMPNINWALGNAERLFPSNETQCKENCLRDCLCSMAFFNNDGTCYKKKYPLSNGKTKENGKSFIKFSMNKDLKAESQGRHMIKLALTGSFTLGTSLIFNLVFIILCLYKRRRRSNKVNYSSIQSLTVRTFTYNELEIATKGFSEEIGRGAFGVVYKGIIMSEPKTLIAVKKLEKLEEATEKDFDNEVMAISKTHHKNLVQLLGFCKEGSNRLLVFEFMINGPLNKFLFRKEKPAWIKRVQIASGIAEGLAYLHEQCTTQIIHCDIKPQNILLDENHSAKISDFGLAKLLKLEQTRTRTCIRGTIGYFAPEWFKHVPITSKVDVHSFGVMLLEIVCCRRNFELGSDSLKSTTLIEIAKEFFRDGRLDLLVEDDEDAKLDLMRLERFVLVAISCIEDNPMIRPSMKQVVQMLDGTVEVTIPPSMHSIHQQQVTETVYGSSNME